MRRGADSITVNTQEQRLEAVADVLARIAEELAFAEPGSPAGLVPLNALLMDLEQIPSRELPAAFVESLALPRRWIDALLDGSAVFDEATLRHIADWHGWSIDFLSSVAVGGTPPALPPALHVEVARPAAVAPSAVARDVAAPRAEPRERAGAAETQRAIPAETAAPRAKTPSKLGLSAAPIR